MEALPTTNNAVFIGSTTPQLLLNATSYNGTVSSVSLKASSNVVVGNDACVIYSTGSLSCKTVSGGTIIASSFTASVNGSMMGDGTPGSPLGVRSSSVAVYTPSGNLSPPYGISVTTVVASSSVTASSFFGDGSHLTGITSTGASLASTQTFTGANTFLSTTDFTSAGNAYVPGILHTFGNQSTAAVSGVATYAFSGSLWVATSTYECEYHLTNSAADPWLYFQFSGDVGSNYSYGTWNVRQPGTGAESESNLATGFLLINKINGGWTQNSEVNGWIKFGTNYGQNKQGYAIWQSENDVAAHGATCNGAGRYTGTNAFTGPTFGISSGNMTGTIICRRQD